MDRERGYTAQEVCLLRRATGMPICRAVALLEKTPEPLRSRMLQAAAEQVTTGESGHLTDPTQHDPATSGTFQRVHREVIRDLPTPERILGMMNRTHHLTIAREMQRRLRNQHGIVWFTPLEMNPGMKF